MFGSCTPYWKEATLTDVFPAMLSLPVSLPLNHRSLPVGFAKMFVKVKSIPARRIFILKNVYYKRACGSINFRIFIPTLTE
jgi:hypothetical protein